MRNYLSTLTKTVTVTLLGALLVASIYCGGLKKIRHNVDSERPSPNELAKQGAGATQI